MGRGANLALRRQDYADGSRNLAAMVVNRALFLLATASLVALGSPVQAASAGRAAGAVVWEVDDCQEAVALVPTNSFGPGATLFITTYRCENAAVGKVRLTDGLGVSEISVLRPDGTSTLLRQVADSVVLVKKLRALGLADTHFGQVGLTASGGPAPVGLSVEVALPEAAYAVSGSSVRPGQPTPSSGGASYTYEGRRGTVRIAYENHAQSFTPAVVTVDAAGDEALQEWLGGRDSVSAPGVFALGRWTGTATLESA